MAYQVVWSPKALEDVEGIAAYIARDSASYAAAVVRNIIKSARKLRRFPLAGRIVPELDDERIREVSAYSYRIVYRFEGQVVTVAAVIHGRRVSSDPTS